MTTVALDVKTVRGARWGEQTPPHLPAFCPHHSQEPFFQVRVDEKTHEIPVAKQGLPTLPIRKPGLYGRCAAYTSRLDGSAS